MGTPLRECKALSVCTSVLGLRPMGWAGCVHFGLLISRKLGLPTVRQLVVIVALNLDYLFLLTRLS